MVSIAERFAVGDGDALQTHEGEGRLIHAVIAQARGAATRNVLVGPSELAQVPLAPGNPGDLLTAGALQLRHVGEGEHRAMPTTRANDVSALQA
jgi:hypothetical protein